MSTTFVPPPPRINLVDRNGKITRPWSDWLLNEVVARIGGETALSNTELAELLQDQAQVPFPAVASQDQDILPPAVLFPNGFPDDPNGRLQALEAELAALRLMVEGIQQGAQL